LARDIRHSQTAAGVVLVAAAATAAREIAWLRNAGRPADETFKFKPASAQRWTVREKDNVKQ
jgi:hypothetical protein